MRLVWREDKTGMQKFSFPSPKDTTRICVHDVAMVRRLLKNGNTHLWVLQGGHVMGLCAIQMAFRDMVVVDVPNAWVHAICQTRDLVLSDVSD